MNLDLSAYPATKVGAWEMVEALTPRIIKLWKTEREERLSDDLIAVINVRLNSVKVDSRLSVCRQIRKKLPTLDLLEHVSKKPSAPNGSICIWVIIGFLTGQLCCLPLTVAYS